MRGRIRGSLLIALPLLLASAGSAGASLTGNWSQTTSLPATGWNMGAAALGGNIYVAGGRGTGSLSPINTVLMYSPTTRVWTPRASLPVARGGLALVASGGLLFAIGGNTTVEQATALTTAYNPATNRWTARALLPDNRTNMGATTGGSYHRIFAVGGYNETTGRAAAAVYR